MAALVGVGAEVPPAGEEVEAVYRFVVVDIQDVLLCCVVVMGER